VWTSVVGGVAGRARVVGVVPAGGGRGVEGSVDYVRPDAVGVGNVVATRGNVGGGVADPRASVVGTGAAGVVVGVRGAAVVDGTVVVRTIVVGAAAAAVVGAVPGGGAVTGVPRATSIGRSPAGRDW
jgi:hypothetical protein